MGFRAHAHRGIADALIGIPKRSRVLIFGSLYLAGEALTLNGTVSD